ncbi:uncharacterized protein LOC142630610 [Castanea sativa]|uniref:uncharacterized protein LOC142630610 n=1 Tax=Castanea sativa TaxID=21020 RepID=UPI003F64D744
MEIREQPNTEGEQGMKVEEQDEWMTSIVRYLEEGQLPEDGNEARKAYKTTTRVPTGETPFRLTFGIEVVIPMEVGLTNIRIKAYKEQRNQQGLNNNLDLINTVGDEAMKRIAKYKGAMTRYYNKKVKVRRFGIGDLVLRKVLQGIKDPSQGKLGLPWDVPYEVIRYSREGSYYLKTLDNQELSHPWNIEHLKRYYQ